MEREVLADTSGELMTGGYRAEGSGETDSGEGGGGINEAAETGKGGPGGSGGVEGAKKSSSLWTAYKRSMSDRPLLTKSVTAATVSALGEVMGSALRRPPPPASLPLGAGTALVVKGRGGAAAPGLLRRTAAFAFFGLVMNGPVFHWWYGALERASARLRQAGEPPGGVGDIAFKLALDRFLITPSYLALTLASLRLLQGLGVSRSVRETRALFRGVLLMNWKVWTIAQLINFKVVPVEFRPVFGNFVACWWNIYLSLLPAQK